MIFNVCCIVHSRRPNSFCICSLNFSHFYSITLWIYNFLRRYRCSLKSRYPKMLYSCSDYFLKWCHIHCCCTIARRANYELVFTYVYNFRRNNDNNVELLLLMSSYDIGFVLSDIQASFFHDIHMCRQVWPNKGRIGSSYMILCRSLPQNTARTEVVVWSFLTRKRKYVCER